MYELLYPPDRSEKAKRLTRRKIERISIKTKIHVCMVDDIPQLIG